MSVATVFAVMTAIGTAITPSECLRVASARPFAAEATLVHFVQFFLLLRAEIECTGRHTTAAGHS